MALEAPLRSSTGSIQFPFNYQKDMSARAESDGFRSPFRPVSSPAPTSNSASLRPDPIQRLSANSMNVMSPSDIVGPSPVTSNGTETTEIEDDMSDDVRSESTTEDRDHRSELMMLSTNISDSVRQSTSEEAVSVIHAPESFASWASPDRSTHQSPPGGRGSPQGDSSRSSTVNGNPEDFPRGSPPQDQRDQEVNGRHSSTPIPMRPGLMTKVQPVRFSRETATPLAQDLQSMMDDGSRLRSSSTSSLEKIDEQTEAEGDDEYASDVMQESEEVLALRSTLQQCWMLCNNLSGLSSIHRTRVFNNSGVPDAHERAWKTCWKLCQRLYENIDNMDEYSGSFSIGANLDLYRNFCQALFDIRQRNDEASDSVLRVSFELNNHLYSAQDSRGLPEEFRERTLDFYITLCHRLMKQRSELVQETDQLLRACWALAEMLFSIRQNKRDGQPADEELLAQAVQACWDLCDIFRDGWTQVRPERSSPRPSQGGFVPHHMDRSVSRQSDRERDRSSVRVTRRETPKSRPDDKTRKQTAPVPETPVTEFEDTPLSPDEDGSPTMPNIMVLGAGSDAGRSGRWPSNSSNRSGYSRSSARTSSTATTTAAVEDANVTRAKVLVLKAAMNLGFDRESVADPKTGSALLMKFVQALPAGSFGALPTHATLLAQYKNSVVTDAIIPRNHTLPPRGKRVSAHEMAKAIFTMSRSSQRYAYLRELFRFVFQFPIEEVDSRRTVSIVV